MPVCAIAAAPGLGWIGYLSPTGVYGDRGGAEVDDPGLARPARSGQRRDPGELDGHLGRGPGSGLDLRVGRVGGQDDPAAELAVHLHGNLDFILARQVLVLQGDGDYEGVGRLLTEMGVIDAELQGDLGRPGTRSSPVITVFGL